MKKRIMIFMSIIMCFSCNFPVFAASFSDINNVPWEGAKTYIESVADLGLMVGDANSSGQKVFRARDNVTYCEVIQLVYNLFGESSSSYETKWSSVLSAYKIPDWAKEATAYALENSIISISELSGFMKNSTTSNVATREDTAVFFGRALAKLNAVDNSAALSFSDSSSISLSSVPYIDLLNRLNVVVGDNNNNFNPKNNINRAEMAVIVTKTYNLSSTPVASKGSEISGTVTAFEKYGSSYLMTVSAGSQDVGFIGDDSVEVINGSKTVKFSSITVGDKVTVNYSGTAINEVTITYDYIDEDTLTGEITYLTYNKIKIRTSGGTTYEYSIEDEEDVSVKIDGSSRDLDELIDMYDDGYTISATLTLDSGDYVTKIVATTESDELEGTIDTLTTSYIKIKTSTGNTPRYYIEDEDDVTVKIDGSTKTLDKLIDAVDDGDTFKVTLTLDSDDYVTKITATTSSSPTGVINGISTSYVKIGSIRYPIKDEDNVTVKIDGTTKTLAKLITAYKDEDAITATLTLDSNGNVIKIIATIGSEDDVNGTISSLSSTRIKLNGASTYYSLPSDTDDVDIEIQDGTSNELSDFEDFEEAYEDDKEMEVTLVIKNDKISEITGNVVKATGDFYSISTSTKTLKIETDSGKYSYVYKSTSSVTVKIDSSTSSVSDLTDLDDDYTVTLTLDDDGYITKIVAES